jgi:hypothetical protein
MIKLLLISIVIGILYIVLARIVKAYVIYYRYKSQGMPVTGFPLPLLGEILEYNKIKQGEFDENRQVRYFKSKLGEDLPPMHLSFINP